MKLTLSHLYLGELEGEFLKVGSLRQIFEVSNAILLGRKVDNFQTDQRWALTYNFRQASFRTCMAHINGEVLQVVCMIGKL